MNQILHKAGKIWAPYKTLIYTVTVDAVSNASANADAGGSAMAILDFTQAS